MSLIKINSMENYYSEILLSAETHTDEELDTGVIDITGLAAKVILFNDEVHSFDEVIIQLMKAINCTPQQGEDYAWEVHTKGKACVYSGDLNECLKVSSVLEEIALHTQIEY